MQSPRLSVTKADIELAESLSAQQGAHADAVFTAVLTACLLKRQMGESIPRKDQIVRRVKPIAPTEFFARLRPRQGTDQVMVAAYFLESFRDASAFTADDLRQCLLEARVKPPANISLAVLRNAQRGLMAQSEKRAGPHKAWILTQTGIKSIEETLAGSAES